MENAAIQVKKRHHVPLWLIAVSILLPTAFSTLATSATNVAIPYISGHFAATVDEASWVVTSYMIANACLILMTGWLEHLFGRKRFLKIFIGIFTIGSCICAVAPSLNFLVLGRLIQGIGGGPMVPMAQTILLSAFPSSKRGLAMSLFGFATMVSAILGPSFGGFIVDNLSWQDIYMVNLPVGIVSIIMISRNIQDTPRDSHAKKVDFVGIVTMIFWLLSMQIVLDKGHQYDWFNCPWIFWLSIFSLCCFTIFIVWESGNDDAIVNLKVFKDKNFIIGTVLSATLSMIVFTTMFLMPKFLQNVLGYTALLSGATLAPRVLSCVVMTIFIPKLMKLYDNRFLIALGFLCMGLSTFMYTNLNLDVSFGYVSIPNVLLGVGVILALTPVSALVLGTLPKAELANGSSLHNLCKTVGQAFVVSMSSTMVAQHSQLHQGFLVENLSRFNLTFQQKMASLTHTFMGNISNIYATTKANAYMYKHLVEQSTLFAYVDTFAVVALMAFILIPFAFLLNTKINDD